MHGHRIEALLPISIELLLAFLVGGAIGLQRELKGKPAGLKTNALICMGACIYTVLSREVFGARDAHIPAQIVSGIGFLGGGAILREGFNVTGLTSAATIWVVGALGALIGYQQYSMSIEAALSILAVLVVLSPAERWIARFTAHTCEERLILEERGVEQISQLFAKLRLMPSELRFEHRDNGFVHVTFTHTGKRQELERLHHGLAELKCRVERRGQPRVAA